MATPEEELELENAISEMLDEPDVPDDKVVDGAGDAEEQDVEEQILAVLANELNHAAGGEFSQLQEARMLATSYYIGTIEEDDPEPGRSRARSTDVADVIGWMMPDIMEGLLDPNGVVAFDPESEEDEQQADIETESVNYVFQKRCNGFITLHTGVKDALLWRNGVWKVYQCEQNKVRRETYEGLNDAELHNLFSKMGEGAEVVEHETYEEELPLPMQERSLALFGKTSVTLHDVTLRILHTGSKSMVEPIPPEEFLFNSDHNSISLEGVRFVAHRRVDTIGVFLEEGWDLKQLENLPPYSFTENQEREERHANESNFGILQASEGGDAIGRYVQVTECYRQFDLKGDGTPELYQVFVGGNAGSYSLLGFEPWDEHPFVGTTPILMSHKFVGTSIFDRCKEIQDQKTAIWRSIQDNLYLQNNFRTAAVVGQVNLDDLLTNRPGGVVRTRAPGMVEPLVTPPLGREAYTALEYLDTVRDGRTGVSPDGAGMNAMPGNSPAHSVERLMTAKEKLVGLIIRVLAETGVKPLMLKLRTLLLKYQSQELPVPIRGSWTTVKPTEWKERSGATVKVGLGTGDRLKQQNLIGNIIQLQAQVAQGGGMGVLVTHKHMHNALEDYVRFSSIGKPENYWQDPDSQEAKAFIQQQQQQAAQQQQMETQAESRLIELQAQLEAQDQRTKQLEVQLKDQQHGKDLQFKYDQLYEQVATKLTELEAQVGRDLSQEQRDNTEGGERGAS